MHPEKIILYDFSCVCQRRTKNMSCQTLLQFAKRLNLLHVVYLEKCWNMTDFSQPRSGPHGSAQTYTTTTTPLPASGSAAQLTLPSPSRLSQRRLHEGKTRQPQGASRTGLRLRSVQPDVRFNRSVIQKTKLLNVRQNESIINCWDRLRKPNV